MLNLFGLLVFGALITVSVIGLLEAAPAFLPPLRRAFRRRRGPCPSPSQCPLTPRRA